MGLCSSAEDFRSKKVVILCTSAEDFQGHKSGAWSEEVTGPFYTFTGKGCEVTIASIKGGKVPIDAFSLGEGFKTENDTKFEATGDVKKLESTVAVSTLAPEAFDCIFLAGGHGTVVDFPDGAADIVSKAAAAGKVVGAVCHGPHGLLKATVGGKPLVAGKKVCGFSNEEEAAVIGMRKFEEKITSLEDELKANGGEYVPGAMFAPNAVRDGSLITGQNPGSSVKAAELCCEALGL
jgi:putative intracellular protease/amidase